ncbi:hypothetical protein PRK78_003703 [Emydomyces testavorans]|uniref:Dynamin family protein n=1 Tax=Emydomyces testavorans TaxID=2070801 RepID=A0AAF0DJP4_9EURO|nr:hypothetical protein PRK78_003703 [Emydomyces testavorans]
MAIRSGSPNTVYEDSPEMDIGNQSIESISRTMKSMVKKIQDLRHLGIENSGLPLPKIVVVGDQSTGKSSLIEGISEIKVPRSAGCCTRCPLEINLSESDAPWTCRVLLMKRYMYVPTGRMPTSKNPLGPWMEQDPEEFLFDTLTEKSMLQEVLRWAQLATLNPGRSYKDYMRDENQETEADTQVKFSPNVVRLDISAPSFPNLSFYDLPGVINVAEFDEERYLVTLVENLVKDYIKADNTIVLLTMPMTDDATNSSAARIIRDVRGARERTLGVLTKPDRIDGGYEQWEELLSGEKFQLGHGYYVVKNNSDPIVTHALAREEERVFFAHPPWRTEFSDYRERFGTRKLQAALSTLLLKQIQNSLPQIVDQINRRAKIVEDELSRLPDPPSANVPYVLCQKLNILMNSIQAHMDGGSSEHPFLKEWGQLASKFQLCLANSRPNLRIAEDIQVRIPAHISADDEDDCEVVDTNASSKRKHVDGVEPDTKRMKKASSCTAGASKGPATENSGQFPARALSFSPREIRNINTDTYASGVPGLGNPQAVEAMNRLSVAPWKGPMHEFLSATYTKIEHVLMAEVEKVFAQYQQTALYGALKVIILQFLDSIRKEHYRQADENYYIETSKPFTLATGAFSKAQEEALANFSRKRHAVRVREYVTTVEEITGKTCNANSVTLEQLGPDGFVKEIEIMAVFISIQTAFLIISMADCDQASRAYYEIASSRFLDVTCQGIHTKLFFRCRNELRAVIEEKLGILGANASERCMELMVEDEARQRRRAQLQREKEKLDKAQEWLKVAEKDSDNFEHA